MCSQFLCGGLDFKRSWQPSMHVGAYTLSLQTVVNIQICQSLLLEAFCHGSEAKRWGYGLKYLVIRSKYIEGHVF